MTENDNKCIHYDAETNTCTLFNAFGSHQPCIAPNCDCYKERQE